MVDMINCFSGLWATFLCLCMTSYFKNYNCTQLQDSIDYFLTNLEFRTVLFLNCRFFAMDKDGIVKRKLNEFLQQFKTLHDSR